MKVVEYSSNHKILHSNSVILFDKNADLELRIKMDDTFSFNLKLVFEKEQKKEISREIDKNTNTITFLMGCEIGDEYGPASIIDVASFEGKKIYFNYIVRSVYNGECKRIDYTLFEG